MAAGDTITTSLADSLQTIIDAARIVREYEGVMNRVVDRQRLPEGTGLAWDEISLEQLTAQSITETTQLDNPQQLVDTLFSLTPVVVGLMTRITDRVARRVAKKTMAKTGVLAQNAVQRKKDIDGLAVYASATTTLAGTGTTLTSGHNTC